MFELSVVRVTPVSRAGQDGLEARDTIGVKVAPRGVKHVSPAARPTEDSWSN